MVAALRAVPGAALGAGASRAAPRFAPAAALAAAPRARAAGTAARASAFVRSRGLAPGAGGAELLGALARRSRRGAATTQAVAVPAKAPRPVQVPSNLHGFEVVRQEYIAEYDAAAVLYRHKKTGAELMSLNTDDENKCFGVVLRTPPADSTGIPHILEHSVLCGSRKYPIKEPFVELMKGSLNTFLNAFTYPDRTCYPVASTNLADFYNLVDVYLDAVYHPKCIDDERTFQQEGWHFELDNPSEAITYKGVVFNEMKGVYSSPDSVLGREVQQALFPDNTYGVDSGGDPAVIPRLTFAQFRDFHARYYHPSNSRLWFYGDDDPEERLRLLDAYLSEFEARAVADSRVTTQPLFSKPARVVRSYAAGAAGGDEDEEGAAPAAGPPKAFITVNWVLSPGGFDTETQLAWGFLDHLMMGTPAAPLRQALEASGLGEALTGGGLEDELVQPTFGVGLKGVKPEDVPKVEALINETLTRLAKEGFTAEAVAASINTIEFSLRENNTGRFPRGLSLMLRAVSSWLYERDAFEALRFAAPLEALKARLAKGDDVFRPLIRQYLLDNPHRVTVELRPDAALGAAAEAAERDACAAKKAALSAPELQALVDATAALKERQETPDAPEALRCMPSLLLSDIPKEAKSIPTDKSSAHGATVLSHELFTNDVLYAEALLDLQTVPARLLPLVPLFCRSLTNMGTKGESFVQLQERIGATTGGLGVSVFTSDVRGQAEPAAYAVVRGKSTSARSGELFDLMRDVLLTARLDDGARFKQMALEAKAGMESRVVGGGHSVAATRIGAQMTAAGWADEQMGGLSYLFYLRDLVKRCDADWAGVSADLETIRAALLGRSGAILNLTGDSAALARAQRAGADFLSALPASGASPRVAWSAVSPSANELLTVPTQVNYVGKGADLYKAGYKLSGSSYVISKLIGTSWLWDRVRVSGGAYGGFCDFDSHSGQFTYLSYRDPNLLKTLDTYDGTPAFLRDLALDQDALTKAIIGTIGDVDSYQLPDAKGYTALMRHVLRVSDAERQQRREEILGTTIKDFRAFAEVLEAAAGPTARVAAVASADAAAAAAAERPELGFKVLPVM